MGWGSGKVREREEGREWKLGLVCKMRKVNLKRLIKKRVFLVMVSLHSYRIVTKTVAKENFEFLALHIPPPEFWDYRCMPPHPV